MMPAPIRRLVHAVRSLVARGGIDRDLDDEMRFHLEMEVALNIQRGMEPREARRAALLAFGGVQRYREQHRAERGARFLERIAQDLRYGARRVRRERGFSIPVIATLGLGIGATVAVGVLADAVLIRPLPYPNAARLVMVGHRAPTAGSLDGGQSESTYLHYLRGNRSLEAFGIYFERDLSLTGEDKPARVVAALVTPSVFTTLGVNPLHGRYCSDTDDLVARSTGLGNALVVISHALWTSRYNGAEDVIGRRIEINRGGATVIGVMPPGFHFPRIETELWYCQPVDAADPGTGTYQTGIGRLKIGITTHAAESDLQRLMTTLPDGFPKAAREMERAGLRRPSVTPLKSALVQDVRPALVLLGWTAAFVLIVAWANAVNLVLVRSETQRRQIAVERALGASTADVAQRLLCESALLALLGGLVAWGIAATAIGYRFGFTPGEIPRLHEVRADGFAIALTTGLAVASALLLGAAAFLRTRSSAVLAALRGGVGRATTGRQWRSTQRALVAIQVGLALALLIASGVMAQSYWKLARFDLGFDPASVLTVEIPLPFRGYPRYDDGARFYDEALLRIRSLPGVVAAEAGGPVPLARATGAGTTPMVASDSALPGGVSNIGVHPGVVSPGWFEAMRIPVIHGRTYRRGDLVSEEHPVVISDALARALFADADPLGRRLRVLNMGRMPSYTIVGVVGDVPGERIPDGPVRAIYFPVLRDLAATPDSAPQVPFWPRELPVVVRGSVAPATLLDPIRRIIAEIDPQVPVTNPRTLETIVDASTARTRLTMLLLLAGAGVALLLGIVGIYGVVSYAVSQRTPEIGIRMALGATPGAVNAMVLKEGVMMTSAGIATGIVAALGVTRLLRGLLFEVSPTDPATFIAMAVLLAGIALVACQGPARRASRIDPVQALRAE
jgi:putative ABC transport system permease protein